MNSVARMIDVLKTKKYLGPIFIGVALPPSRTKKAMQFIDNGAAELAATSRIRRP